MRVCVRITRASTAMARSAKASSGFTSSSAISGKSAARRPTRIRISSSAARSTGGAPRTPVSILKPRMPRTISAASSRLIGATRKTASRSTSTKTPPSPNPTSAPSEASTVVPVKVSTPPRTIAWTSTPEIAAPGTAARARATMSLKASRTSCSSARSTRTPPTSVLWTMSGATILSTTGKPAAAACCTAWSASQARVAAAVGMP